MWLILVGKTMNMINLHQSGHPVPAVQFQSFVWGSPDRYLETIVLPGNTFFYIECDKVIVISG